MKYVLLNPFVYKHLINKELEKYNIDYDFIKKKDYSKEYGCEWYEYYRFNTKEEFEEWKKYCIEFLTTQITPKLSKRKAFEIFSWFNLSWGLKCNY